MWLTDDTLSNNKNYTYNRVNQNMSTYKSSTHDNKPSNSLSLYFLFNDLYFSTISEDSEDSVYLKKDNVSIK